MQPPISFLSERIVEHCSALLPKRFRWAATDWQVSPQAWPVIAAILTPWLDNRASAVAKLEAEARGCEYVEAEHAIVVVTAKTAFDLDVGFPGAIECRTDIFL
jgi:hypothetical protein